MQTAPEPPLFYDKPALNRVFRRRRLVDELIASGRLPTRDLHGRVVVLRDELLDFLRNLPRLEAGL